MAQVILSRVGATIGARIAPAFATAGRALGRALGRRIDSALFGETRRIEGPRLTDAHFQTSEAGASLPIVYGRVRIAGQVIWAARYRERADTRTSGGGKSGRRKTVTTEYSYSLSFAVGLCAGEIARVERAWANGKPFDLSAVAHRVHAGGEDQAVDPLIEAIEGADFAPAYRGLAYIVFEDLPLAEFGDAIPQFSFEVVRPPPAEGPRLESLAKAVSLIPGAGEFVYATDVVRRVVAEGREAAENAHAAMHANLAVSLDQLQADLPHVDFVSLVVGWFGDDLRAGACAIRPRVEIAAKATRPLTWRAGGLTRATAPVVSTVEGAPAYGGTPDDLSVLQAIAELKRRGLKVGLNPFLFMDIPPGNTLPDPSGAGTQPPYPWRGRVGVTAGADKTPAAAAQVDAFFGAVTPGAFSNAGGAPACAAPDWKYRQFILHYAHLAALAGGVDVFVIGSELRALTTARSGPVTFPAVAHLRALAADVRAVLGPAVAIVYAADWSEYAGHRPQDGTGDVFFHLDPLWADANIAAVAIDWYPPLADWRDGAGHLDAVLSVDGRDRAYLAARIEGGEGFDWFYATPADRAAQVRTPIADGAHGKPWVYRVKDIRSFWSNPHVDRPGGVPAATPTAWAPQSKPVWLMELGVPAIDKGANAPNLFVDPKSSESAAPPFSSGVRDDLVQRRALEAYLDYWRIGGPHNPVSTLDGRPMIERVCLWAWDARPFPHFPARADVWADGPAWRRGHWLNGRAGAATLAEVVSDLCARGGAGPVDASALSGVAAGFVVDAPTTLAAALEPLMGVYRFAAHESGGALVFRHLDDAPRTAVTPGDLAEAGATPFRRAAAYDIPHEVRLRFIDGASDYRIGAASARQRDADAAGVLSLDAPLVLDDAQAATVCEAVLADARAAADGAELALAPARLDLEPGDLVDAAAVGGGAGLFRIALLRDDGGARRAHLVGAAQAPRLAPAGGEIGLTPAPEMSRPLLVVLDLPPLPGAEEDERPLAAVSAHPWRGPVTIHVTGEARGVATRAAGVGELLWALHPGPLARRDEGNVTRIRMPGVDLSAVDDAALFAGANAFAVAQPDGGWEIVQAQSATLVAPDTWELRRLLRGLAGTETAQIAPVGARIVRLDGALARLDIAPHERGAALLFRAPPSGLPASHPDAAAVEAVAGDAWARPLAPGQVRGRRLAGGDVALTWVRRARLGGDAWQGEPPLGEAAESYRVDILSGAAVVRTFEALAPAAFYPAADQIADFGTLPASLAVRIRQISQRHGPGRGRDSILQL